MPRASLTFACAIHAVVFAAAMWLPWRAGTPFAFATGTLALWHSATAALAVIGSPRLPLVWRGLSWASLLYAGWIGWDILHAALYIESIYGSFGRGVAVAIAAGYGLVVLFTVPIAWWGLAASGGNGARAATVAALAALVGSVIAAGLGATRGRVEALPSLGRPDAAVESLADVWPELPALEKNASLYLETPARCGEELGAPLATAFVTFAHRDTGAPTTRCVQALPDELEGRIARLLRDEAGRAPVKLDFATGTALLRPLRSALLGWADGLALRPGLDGACLDRSCLAPWQLVALDMFAAAAPVPTQDKFRMGFSTADLREHLGEQPAASDVSGLARIETESFVIDARGTPRALRRMREREVEATPGRVARASNLAERFITQAQGPDGSFRVALDPYRGESNLRQLPIARHAGATMALCELSSARKRASRAIGRATRKLSEWERTAGGHSALELRARARAADLGATALGLVALLTCRERSGDGLDGLIARLGSTLLFLQREDGSFAPGLDLSSGRALSGPTPVFAGGQAIYALSLLEKLSAEAGNEAEAPLPDPEVLRAAVNRAMDFVAADYWPEPLRSFFFLKENWHCLAARASLPHHRHDGYERFCIDYMTSRSRLVLDPDEGVDPELVGGYGFGNVVPPHNGSSAGVGESLAAAIEIKRARGLDTSADEARMREIIRYLLRQQWTSANCFACQAAEIAAGGFSGYLPAASGRIDHAQHAWSAIGHGARVLGIAESSEAL